MTIRRHDAPPASTALPHLPLIRVPTAGEIVLAITCWELLQIDTHFMGRRTLPCVENDCPGCAAQKPRRYEAYVSGLRGKDHRHLIIALTAGAVQNLFDQVPARNQLRGHLITITRSGRRNNGMLRINVGEHMLGSEKLPAAPELDKHLYRIWGLENGHVGQDHLDYSEAVKKMYNRRPDDGA